MPAPSSEAPEAEPQAEPLIEEEQADTEGAAAEVTWPFRLDSDNLLDELAEGVLGQPEVSSPGDDAAAQLVKHNV